VISKRELLISTSQSATLTKILAQPPEDEKSKQNFGANVMILSQL
jgi:hypothetical protein